jgi:hypothetical protein
VVAGDGKYRRGVITIGIVELIVIILSFAKAVYDIAQMKEKEGTERGSVSSKSPTILSATSSMSRGPFVLPVSPTE